MPSWPRQLNFPVKTSHTKWTECCSSGHLPHKSKSGTAPYYEVLSALKQLQDNLPATFATKRIQIKMFEPQRETASCFYICGAILTQISLLRFKTTYSTARILRTLENYINTSPLLEDAVAQTFVCRLTVFLTHFTLKEHKRRDNGKRRLTPEATVVHVSYVR